MEPAPATDPESRKELELRDRVQRHKICWHAWPEHHVCGSERRQVGFRLRLLGSYEQPNTRPITSSAEFWKVYTSLHELARWILPQEGEDSDLQISVFDASLTPRGDRQDIMITIKIVHRQGFDRPLDAGELQCLAAMEEKLLRLGAPRERWQ